MSDPRDRPDPLEDEDNPIIGTPSARIHMIAGLIILAIIVAVLVWFIASNANPPEEGAGIIGSAEPAERALAVAA